MDRFLLVFVAGGLGSGLRYLISAGLARALGPAFPFGTLCVNLGGCLLMGFVMQLALSASSFSPNVRLALTTGFLGGLTTYSSFNYDTTKLVETGSTSLAVTNVVVTLLGCAAAGLAGAWLGRRLAI